MMEQSPYLGLPPWKFGQLYTLMTESFPAYRTKRNALDVGRLGEEMGKTNETIYKWFRKNQMTPKNVSRIIELARGEANLSALARLGKEPPTFEQFQPFVYVS